MIGDHGQPGSPSHAEAVTAYRHQATKDALQWLTYSHLPEALQQYSAPFYTCACAVLAVISVDSPELTKSLNDLTDAKDDAVRAGIRNQTGRAGSVPRPQDVVDPPKLEPHQAAFVKTDEAPPLNPTRQAIQDWKDKHAH